MVEQVVAIVDEAEAGEVVVVVEEEEEERDPCLVVWVSAGFYS